MPDNKIINQYLRDGNFKEAYNVIEEILKEESNFETIFVQHKIIKYWINRIEVINKIKDPYEKGLYLLNEWKNFCNYIREFNVLKVVELESISYFIHNSALESFIKAKEEGEFKEKNLDLLLKIALCYKELGNYDESIGILKYVYNLNHDPQILIYLADLYYLKGEYLSSRLIFKEVFFFENYFDIDFCDISCDVFFNIIDKIKRDGFNEFEINYWIPVYGFIEGFFNVRRELIQVEVEKIKTNLNSIEKSYYSDDGKIKQNLKPVLIKNYIILLEYYFYQEFDKNKFEQYLDKIKNMDSLIYEKIKNNFNV
jgi:hypothetical protein